MQLKQYINRTIKNKAKIGYDRTVKCWYGILDHKAGLMLSQAGSRAAVEKELAEIFEDFIILFLEGGKKKDNYNGTKPYKVQAAYR